MLTLARDVEARDIKNPQILVTKVAFQGAILLFV